MSITQTFWLGVASGVVATLIVLLLRRLLWQVISMIGGLFTRSVRGTWNTMFWKGADTFEEQATVYQLLHWVRGTIVYPRKGRTYYFRGSLRGNVLVATYEVTGQRSTIDRGAFTLAVNSTGEVREMIGKYSWTDDASHTPESDKYEWRKRG